MTSSSNSGSIESSERSVSRAVSSSTTLCDACLRIFSETKYVRDMHLRPKQADKSSEKYTIKTTNVLAGGHYAHPNGCKEASERGCPICVFVFERFCILFDRIITFTKESNVQILSGYFTEYQVRPYARKRRKEANERVPDNTFVLEITFESIRRVNNLPVQFDVTECMVEFLLLPKQQHPSIFTPRTVATRTDSAECWNTMKTWLKICLEKHTACNTRTTSQDFCPTRLLKFNLEPQVETNVFLCDNAHPACKYIALSHRWGSDMPILVDPILPTESKNSIPIEELRAGIPISRLPPTFRDAVVATTELGVQYLWIDSMCIIQNSEDDWNKESVQMHNVYGHAFCTLASTSSPDGSGRLFNTRKSDSVQLYEVTPSWDSDGASFGILPLDFWRVNVHDAALNRRGWVLQERMLSARVLHFGKRQILWECNECDWCETFPDGLPRLLPVSCTRFKGLDIEKDGKPLMQRIVKELDGVPMSTVPPAEPSAGEDDKDLLPVLSLKQLDIGDKMSGLEGYYLWSRILEKYCSTRLTYGKDKLLAISGLAKRMEILLHDQCFSGLWKKIMPSQLLWRIEEYETRHTMYAYAQSGPGTEPFLQKPLLVYASRPEQDRAPSWSWASIDGIIAPPFPSFDQGLIRCIAASGKEQQAHQGGLPLVTHLILEGAIHFAKLQYEPMIRRWKLYISPRGIRTKTPLEPATAASATLAAELLDFVNPDNLNQQAMGVAYPDIEMDIHELHFVLCLPIMQRTRRKALSGDVFDTSTKRISGLLLDSQMVERGTYRRLGIFDLFGNDLITNWFSCHPLYQGMFNADGNIVLI